MRLRIVTLGLAIALGTVLTTAVPVSAMKVDQVDAESPLADLLLSGGMTREEMVGLYEALALGDFEPPPCVPGDEMFDDVPASSPFCPWIEELARRGVTGGCDDNNFCPGNPVTRAQMAAFVVRAIDASQPIWGFIRSNGVVAGENGIISVETPVTGVYEVTVDRGDLEGCAMQATINNVTSAGFTILATRIPENSPAPDRIRVEIWRDSENTLFAHSFSLTVQC